LKSKLTISEIGKFRFYSGIIIGLGYSVIFNYLFRFALRICNYGKYIEEWRYDYEISPYYYLLIGFASVGFSFSFTTYLWLSKPKARIKNRTLKLRFAQTSSIWVFFVTLFFLLRMFWFFASIDLTIEKDYRYVAFLLPVFIYMYCWSLIRSVYKSRKIFWISLLLFIIIGFVLSII